MVNVLPLVVYTPTATHPPLADTCCTVNAQFAPLRSGVTWTDSVRSVVSAVTVTVDDPSQTTGTHGEL
jgi:hypothetical protein